MGRQTIHQPVSNGRAALAAVLGGLAAGLVLALPAQAAGDGTARLERRVRDIEARLGEHNEVDTNANSYTTPTLANVSTSGVSRKGWPSNENAS